MSPDNLECSKQQRGSPAFTCCYSPSDFGWLDLALLVELFNSARTVTIGERFLKREFMFFSGNPQRKPAVFRVRSAKSYFFETHA